MKRALFLILITVAVIGVMQDTNLAYSSNNAPVAIVSQSSGRVTVLNKSGAFLRGANRLTKIYPDEIIATANGSSCTILFKDRSHVKLEANSKVLISKVNVSANQRRGIGVLQGGVFVKVFNAGRGSSFSAFTPTAVAGVRGTEFRVSIAADGSSQCQVVEGTVDFSSGQNSARCTAGTYGRHNTGEELQRGRSSGDLDAEDRNWQRNREQQLARNPEAAMQNLDSDIKKIEQRNQQAMQKLQELRGTQVSRENAGQVAELDGVVVENAARSRAIRESSRNIARRHRNNPRVDRFDRSINQSSSTIENQINMMDKFIEQMGKQIDKLINQQEGRIDNMMDNFMQRGFQRR